MSKATHFWRLPAVIAPTAAQALLLEVLRKTGSNAASLMRSGVRLCPIPAVVDKVGAEVQRGTAKGVTGRCRDD